MSYLKNLSFKSKVAPKGLIVYRNYLQIGDKYVKVVTILNTPKEYHAGILAVLTSNANIKVDMMTEPSNENIPDLLNKEINRMNREYKETADETKKASIKKKIESLSEMVKLLVTRRDSTFNVVINILIQADSIEELNESYKKLKMQLGIQGWQMKGLSVIQEKLYKRTSPFWHNDGFSKEMKKNIGVLLPSLNLAAFYPFMFDTLNDKYGLLIGNEQYNGGKIMFDQFIYLNEEVKKIEQNRLNGNMIVVGKSGSGKTTVTNLIMMQHMFYKRKIIWLDPENKIGNLIQRANGSYFNMGGSKARINIFDLKPISSDDDKDDNDKYNTKLAIFNVVEDIKIVLKYLNPNIRDETLAVIGAIAEETYKSVGIDETTKFKHLSYEQYPTFTNFNAVLDEYIEKLEKAGVHDEEYRAYKDLSLRIKPLIKEYAIYFDGKTTINVSESSNPFIGFGTKVFFNLTEGLCNALMHIILQFSWGLCLDESQYSIFCVDEAHLLILAGSTAKMIEQFVRRSRKYKNATILTTQEVHDFADQKILTSGKAIFNSSTYKMIMNLERDGIYDLAKLTTLTDGEKKLIGRFRMGEAIFIAGNKRIPIRVQVTNDMFKMMQ